MDPYGLDPIILDGLKNNTLTLTGKRAISGGGIGIGTPITFPFKYQQQLSADWSTSIITGGGPNIPPPGEQSINPGDGFLKFITAGGANMQAMVNRAFSLDNASVAIAFPLTIDWNPLPSTTFQLGFVGGPELYRTSGSGEYKYRYNGTDIGTSAITGTGQDDDSEHRIVITIESGIMCIWEDDKLVSTVMPPILSTNIESVQVAFGITDTDDQQRLSSAMMIIGDVIVQVGLNQEIRYNVPRSEQTDFAAQQNYLQRLAPLAAAVPPEVSSVLKELQNIPLGPGVLFWGLQLPEQLGQAISALFQNQKVVSVRNAALSEGWDSATLFLGVTVNLSFILSGGASLGVMSDGQGQVIVVLVFNGGLVTNAGAGIVVDLAFMPNLPSENLGWGSYIQLDYGEGLQGSVGFSGGIPLHIGSLDNCGPAFSIGGGISLVPGDIAGGFSYTKQLGTIMGG